MGGGPRRPGGSGEGREWEKRESPLDRSRETAFGREFSTPGYEGIGDGPVAKDPALEEIRLLADGYDKGYYDSYEVIEPTRVDSIDARRASQAEAPVVRSFFRPLADLLRSIGVAKEAPEAEPIRSEAPIDDVYGPHYYRDRSFYEGLPFDGLMEDGTRYFPTWNLEGKTYEVSGEGMVTFTGRVFGQGSASTVYEAVFDSPDGQRVVAVKIRDHALDFLMGEEAAIREVDTLMQLPDEIAPGYYGMMAVEGATAIVMDVAPGQYWTQVDPARINEKTVEDLHAIFDTLEGMGWRPSDFQVTVDEMGRAHLIDFEGLNVESLFPTTRSDVFLWFAKLRSEAGLPTEFLDREIGRDAVTVTNRMQEILGVNADTYVYRASRPRWIQSGEIGLNKDSVARLADPYTHPELLPELERAYTDLDAADALFDPALQRGVPASDLDSPGLNVSTNKDEILTRYGGGQGSDRVLIRFRIGDVPDARLYPDMGGGMGDRTIFYVTGKGPVPVEVYDPATRTWVKPQ